MGLGGLTELACHPVVFAYEGSQAFEAAEEAVLGAVGFPDAAFHLPLFHQSWRRVPGGVDEREARAIIAKNAIS